MGTVVDDMGADYASVEYLAALQPDFVKIDRDLVVRAELEKRGKAEDGFDRIPGEVTRYCRDCRGH